MARRRRFRFALEPGHAGRRPPRHDRLSHDDDGGSLLQILPAVAGLPLRCPPRQAVWTCPLLGAGGALLAVGFLSGRPLLFALAWVVLTGSFALLLACLIPTLGRRAAAIPAVAHIVGGMRGAVAVLAVGIAAGLALAGWLAGGPAVPVAPRVDSHAALGFADWVALPVLRHPHALRI
ncbi:hypothetical protein HAV22_04730 [Massilia sp. TW-1]|uniref:Uncharacterized protein n=1 Tax=Telluria antibiotica TaxID=2717319 RepID=A0ABX0P6U2_9BURK|nr:hypothetical protein [Telluria antibiotica]NIA52957.1 hypothetical protein [Telluria antibiotica]